jgi:hypothetical protein
MTQGLASLYSDCVESVMQNSHVPHHREHGAVVIEAHNGSDPGHCSQALTERRAAIGIIVFSSTCKTLYANQAAYEFLKVLNRWENGHATDGALPGAIAGLYDQVELMLARRIKKGDGETLEARGLLMGEGRTVQLHAFGLHDRLEVQGSRVVITMQVLTHSVSDESGRTIPVSI